MSLEVPYNLKMRKIRKRLNNKFITFGRIMKDGIISYDNIKAYATQLVTELVF